MAELALMGLFAGLAHSLLLGLILSLGLFGPVSLWLAPALLAHYRRAERRAATKR